MNIIEYILSKAEKLPNPKYPLQANNIEAFEALTNEFRAVHKIAIHYANMLQRAIPKLSVEVYSMFGERSEANVKVNPEMEVNLIFDDERLCLEGTILERVNHKTTVNSVTFEEIEDYDLSPVYTESENVNVPLTFSLSYLETVRLLNGEIRNGEIKRVFPITKTTKVEMVKIKLKKDLEN